VRQIRNLKIIFETLIVSFVLMGDTA
jgi:hypothetical protein